MIICLKLKKMSFTFQSGNIVAVCSNLKPLNVNRRKGNAAYSKIPMNKLFVFFADVIKRQQENKSEKKERVMKMKKRN